MARDDWYRNKEWNAAIEASFRVKLSRARSQRAQYLYIQANCLTDRHPQTTLSLIEEYFETGDEFNVSNAFCSRAKAYCSLGEIDRAVRSYRRALSWEEKHPNVISPARTSYPRLVAEHRISNEYEFALDVLSNCFDALDHQFPKTRYDWYGSNALIASELGHHAKAREFAELALLAAAQTESPFRYHRYVGLVSDTADDFGKRIKRVARSSIR